LSDQKLY
jgi:hypothetical protein